jgi:hypothetical protein
MWKLNNVLKDRMGDQNLLSPAPLCFGRHVKLLIPAAFRSRWHPLQFQGGLKTGWRPVVKIVAESLSQHGEKYVVPTPLSGIRDEKQEVTNLITNSYQRNRVFVSSKT